MITAHDVSRRGWSASEPPTWEQVNSGSFQRIADAVEKMAASYDAMRNERDRYKRYYEDERQVSDHLRLQIRSLRGVITRLKNRRPSAGGRQP